MTNFTKIKNGAKLTVAGEYEADALRTDAITLANKTQIEGAFTLSNVEKVIGSKFNDTVILNTAPLKTGTIDLGNGNDTLQITNGDYNLTVKNTETVIGTNAVEHLQLAGVAAFSTDGSIDAILGDKSGQTVTFTTLNGDSTINLGGGNDKVILGTGYTFYEDLNHQLLAVKNGFSLTFADYATTAKNLTVQVGGHNYSYTELLHGNLVNGAPLTATIAENNTDGVVSDDDPTVTYTVTFNKAVQALAAGDLDITGGSLVGNIVLAQDKLSATFVVTATDGSTGNLVVGLNDTVLGLDGSSLIPSDNTLTLDTQNPTATFATSNNDGVVSDADATVTYTVTFSEAVAALLDTDLSIAGGSYVADSILLAGDGLSATFQVLATDNSIANLVVGLNDTVLDLNGNTLVVPTPNTLAVDTVNPTVTALTEDNADGVVSDADATVTYTVTFSEAVAALLDTDLSIAGGSYVADSILLAGDGLSATFQVLATDNSIANLVVGLNDTVLDLNGNTLVVPTPNTLAVDTVNPVAAAVTLYSGDANATVNAVERTAGFTISGTNESGAIVTLAGQTVVADSLTAWHVALDAATIDGYGQGAEALTLVSTDAAGNTTDTAVNLTVDTVAPVAAAVTLYSGDANATVNAVERTAGFTIAGTNESGAIVTLAGQTVVADSLTAWHVALDAATIDGYGQGAEALTLVSTDVAGNTTDTAVNLTVDTVAPTFTVSAVDTSGSPDYFTVTFNEAVTGFTFSDLSTDSPGSFGFAQPYNEPLDMSGGIIFMVRFDDNETIASGDTITLIGAVTDAAGNNALGAFALVG